MVCGFWVEARLANVHVGHLLQRQGHVVGIAWTRDIHLVRTSATKPLEKGFPVVQELGRHLVSFDSLGQPVDVVEVSRVQQLGEAKQCDPLLDDYVAGEPPPQSLGQGSRLVRLLRDQAIG